MTKKRLAVYIRTSINADSNITVKFFKDLIAQREDCELVDIYLDKGASGMNKNRPMLKRMVKDGKAKKFDYAVCKSVAKLSRDAEIAFEIINDLKSCGVGVYCIDENIDSLSEDFNVYETVMREASISGKIMSEEARKYEAEHPELFAEDYD